MHEPRNYVRTVLFAPYPAQAYRTPLKVIHAHKLAHIGMATLEITPSRPAHHLVVITTPYGYFL